MAALVCVISLVFLADAPQVRIPGDAALEAVAVDGLTLAARCLERGDQPGAVRHLADHADRYPQQVMVRAYLAELLFKLERRPESRHEFERFIMQAQSMTGPPRTHLVHCHTRLMMMAEQAGDRYHESLHRGIGLCLLAKSWGEDGDEPKTDTLTTATLVQAADTLRDARAIRPADARVNLYLADVYKHLGQPVAARQARIRARAGSPGGLTPYEAERLAVEE